ncbi:SpvB/TcaC N-terminal domain-containing protein [Polaromonas sp.]|uniref:SpvB/TcaC N-terminal domain-containing protein n=1 Tax=Polaromonas sp. TaxID=1869339 RepID=UPI003266FF69
MSLPKGGGAIRGIGEKFSANSATGTGRLSVPLPISPGRGGFQPNLSIDYDSGAGNGPFGMGWRLGLPSITRKTEKGLPRYLDAEESDIFLLGGVEDLVPVTVTGGSGERETASILLAGRAYRVRRYRPRVEGLFSLIERWSGADDPAESFWRVLDRSNMTQWFGRAPASRIVDPSDPSRVFQWLPCESHDDKGNAIVYDYVADNADAIDPSAPWEIHRAARQRSSQRYLKRIRYGNRTPYLPNLRPNAPLDSLPSEWLLELVFDYGDHTDSDPQPEPDRVWPSRPDPFSNHRPGFEVRATRRCERALMFHHIAEASEVGAAGLIRSMRFRYAAAGALDDPLQPGYSVMVAAEPWSHERGAGGTLESRPLPPLEFRYSLPRVDSEVRTLMAADLQGLPVGIQGTGVQWVDLDGEGVSGVLTEEAGTWRYAANLGGGRFEPSRAVAGLPTRRALTSGGQRLMDLNGNGEIDVVDFDRPMPGFYERDPQDDWKRFMPFSSLPQIRWDDPNLRFLDLTGNGHADALVTEDDVFTWYPSLAESGFSQAEHTRPPHGEEGVRLVFSDGTQTLFLADMCGDGLTDIVRIRNGEACYWPNLGYGRFGRKVNFGNPPRFDHDDLFDPRRIRLADIDGSGPVDILYLGREGVQLYFNRSGNTLSHARKIPFPLATHNLAAVQLVDLFGRGTACLVWNSHLPADSANPVRYIDLMGDTKPHLLVELRNNLGGSTEIEYTPSTHFYLADKAAGTPWITRLPFPVQCVSRVTVRDMWRGTAFSSTYSYHHGCFDGIEREFRGFGRVEQIDVEDYGRFEQTNGSSPWITDDHRLFQPPVKTVTWYHTGVATDGHGLLTQFRHEYFVSRYRIEGSFRERDLSELLLDEDLGADERREALRALKGMVLRQEVYELDLESLVQDSSPHHAVRLYSVATHSCRIQRLQPRGQNRHAVFLVTESEVLNYQHEMPLPLPGGVVTPDPRIAHTLALRVDEHGQPLQTVAVGYPRIGRFEDDTLDEADLHRVRAVQAEAHLAYTEARFTQDVLLHATMDPGSVLRHHRLRLPCELRSFELTGISHAEAFYYRLEDFAGLELSDHYSRANEAATPIGMTALPYHRPASGTVPQRRLVEHLCTLYFDDSGDAVAPTVSLPWGQHGPRGLKYEDYKLALTDELLDAVFQTPGGVPGMSPAMLDWELQPGVSARSLLDNPQRSGYARGEDIATRFAPDATSADMAGQYWLRSGTAGFAGDAARHFYLPERYTDSFGAVSTLEYDVLDLYVRSVTDARQNRSEVLRFDHRALMPVEMVDANGNHTEACIDILGQVVAVAVKGKPTDDGWQGDDLETFHAEPALRNPAVEAVQAFCTQHELDGAQARTWLARAGGRFVYHFGEARATDGRVTTWAVRPAMACAITREVHAGRPGGDNCPLQIVLQCSDGGGNVLMAKQQAEPEVEGGPLRWIVNGLAILNNKGKPVKQYEPFFSNRFGCELPREEGVTPILFYDAAGRVIRTDLPDGTLSRIEFSPWYARQFDASDTVLESSWYAERLAVDASAEARRAARLSALHANTPELRVLDSLGREVIAITHNRSPSEASEFGNTPLIERPWLDERHLTHTCLDAEGKPLWVRDARGNLVMQYICPPKPNSDHGDDLPPGSVPAYDIAGNLLCQHSMDAGDRWMLSDSEGKPMLHWDLNDRLEADGQLRPEARLAYTEYDLLHRPLRQWLRFGTASAAVVERFDYRDTADPDPDEARALNLIGQAVRHDDPSGRIELLRLGFTGQVQHEKRRMARHHPAVLPDWQGDEVSREALLERETFARLTEHDALGRMTQMINWHRHAGRVAVYRPQYNARDLLEAENLSIGARLVEGVPQGGRISRAVHGITYNARGQRTCLRQGNGTETRYAYDRRNFRLMQLRTARPAADLPFPGFRSNLRDERVVQQLHYTYDAAGNVAEILDEAWAPVFFRNQAVEPRSRYVYDALHRLLEATGRESAQFSAAPDSLSEVFGVDAFPADHALRNYLQRYRYDAVGNFITMQHSAEGGSWTRHYHTATDSNRLLRTWTGGDEAAAVRYTYDVHGSMLNTANVPDPARIRWDWRDMIESLDLGGGGRAWYAYDMGKQRTRKRIEKPGGVVEVRLYLGGMELYRRYAPSGDVMEEIETQHLFVDDQRVLLAEQVVSTDNPRLGAGVLLRYQYSNHLGSVALELDETSRIIGSEEFHPYGTTAYHLSSRSADATPKRYRYTGMERDEETGFSYHTARYYAPWLGRWAGVDPLGTEDALNVYSYARASPINRLDVNGMQSSSPEYRMPLPPGGVDRVSGEDYGPPIPPPPPLSPSGPDLSERLGAYVDADAVNAEYEAVLAGRSPELRASFLRFVTEVSFVTLGPERDYAAEGRTTDIIDDRSEVHEDAVLFILHSALDNAYNYLQESGQAFTLFNVLLLAREFLTQVRRYDDLTSQNITLRDAQHYFAGRIAQWRIMFDSSSVSSPPSWASSLLSDVATVAWDALKLVAPDWTETSSFHSSPVGGEHWASRGSSDYRQLDLEHASEAVRPEDPARGR